MVDTTTLIAAMLPDHVHHAACFPCLAQAKAGTFEFFVSAHSLAEVYAVLTRLPGRPQIDPAEAWQLLQPLAVAPHAV